MDFEIFNGHDNIDYFPDELFIKSRNFRPPSPEWVLPTKEIIKSKVLVLGFYDKSNLGDELFKEVIPDLLKSFECDFKTAETRVHNFYEDLYDH